MISIVFIFLSEKWESFRSKIFNIKSSWFITLKIYDFIKKNEHIKFHVMPKQLRARKLQHTLKFYFCQLMSLFSLYDSYINRYVGVMINIHPAHLLFSVERTKVA